VIVDVALDDPDYFRDHKDFMSALRMTSAWSPSSTLVQPIGNWSRKSTLRLAGVSADGTRPCW